ncbi:uncharacterized protein LOC111705710 isoform X1 [Eurytemora carolleeae]|uniref:uncharacterized protein LOC111705710 isoform X1 n=1 Tax=Eurytemora carolleeae TaxID=1294199 RepID=UPI000C78D0E4|nr:uncharacterized protein LOC111705710 isoform X1 [Eurytemora carolleeae]|eukprot:XP_023334119.1 uncharacterized protein LOC111705710 isoform X1 [Eurytemora affinis]
MKDFNKEEIDVVNINQPIEMELDQCILKNVRPAVPPTHLIFLSSSLTEPSQACSKSIVEKTSNSLLSKSSELLFSGNSMTRNTGRYWYMQFREKLFHEVLNPTSPPDSDSDEEENIQELDENNTETKKEIDVTKDDGFEVEDERRVHKEEGFQNSALKCIDPIVFAPTGDIYSYFQRRRFEADRLRFPLVPSTILTFK